jgi:hypothetical protein
MEDLYQVVLHRPIEITAFTRIWEEPSQSNLGQMWMQHSRKKAEIPRLKQSHIQGEESGREDECNDESACIAERFCGKSGVRPETSNDDKQI